MIEKKLDDLREKLLKAFKCKQIFRKIRPNIARLSFMQIEIRELISIIEHADYFYNALALNHSKNFFTAI
jgi:hypothetical protein